MKSIINFSLNNKFAIWLLTIMVTIAGLYSGLTMKQEMLPNLNLPFLSVTTVYPGAAPESVVEEVTKPLEQRLRNIDGLKNLTSTSMENVSSIMIEFEFGQDIDAASNQIREVIEGAQLPQGVQKSQVAAFSINSFPVVALSAANGEDLEELTDLIEAELVPALQGISGVASVSTAGQFISEVQLKFNQGKLAEYGLSEETVKGLIQASALKVPLGMFELDESDKAVVVDGQITTLDELKNIMIPVMPSMPSSPMGEGMGGMAGMAGMENAPVPSAGEATGAPAGVPDGASHGALGGEQDSVHMSGPQGSAEMDMSHPLMAGLPTVKLGDIADIELVGQAESISRTNGKESIGLQVVKVNNANTVEVVNLVKEETERFGERYQDLELVVMMDQAKPIEDSVSTMLEKAVYGAIFAVLIILLFLRNFRTTIISIISIPLSILIAMLFLRAMDITLNIMTLGAMTVAIGRVVDDSIVVIENIYRRMSLSSEKLKGKELIREATREMSIPIFSSTIVTIAVFIPLGLVGGVVGELFLPFALTISFALLASLLVAVTIVPMLGHSLFKAGLKGKQLKGEKPGVLARFYQGVLEWVLNHKLITFSLAIIVLASSFFLVPVVGVSFLPDQEDKFVMITYSPDPGDLLEDVEQRALEAEKYILDRPNVMSLQYSVGGENPLSPGPSKSGLFFIQYDSATKEFEEEKKALVNGLKSLIPSGEWKEMQDASGFGGSQMSIGVYGETLEQIKPVVDQVEEIMRQSEGLERVENSLSKSYDQYKIIADQEKLSKLGLTAGQIAMKLSPVRERPVLMNIKVEDKTYPVIIEADQEEFKSIEEIKNATIASPLGMEVAIKDVAQVEEGTTPNAIARHEGQMVVNVTATVLDKNVAGVSQDIQKQVNKLSLPSGVEVKFGGVTEQITETFTQLGLAMAAAVGIVYFILVITFGGALAPFSILFSLPFIVIGALVGLYFAGESISVSAMMGGLMLIGIVVTNAIVLIARVRQMENEGASTREALMEAGATRLRPILMTALATIGALLPLIFGHDGGGIISRGLGVTVIGGLLSSTLLTLIIVPIVYEFLMKFRKKESTREA